MSEKIIQSRIVQKHDTEANWIGKTTFVPKQGEVIVYDTDSNYNYERIKIGDGKTVVSSLPFIDDHALGQLETVKLQIQDLSIDGGTYRGNLNNAEANKVYWCALANCTNGPQSSGYGFLEVWTGLQRFTVYNTGDTYMRAYANDAWNDWQVVNEDKFVPASRTVNGKALSSNISLSASDVGAAPINHIHKSVSNPQMNYVDAIATAEDESICPLNTTTFLRWYHPTNAPLANIDGYAIIRKLNVAPYTDLEFIQSGTGRRWLNTKGDSGWTGWVEKGTLEDIGAAPAGFGLGATEAKFLTSADDLNSINKSGWYQWSESAPANAPTIKWSASYSFMRVDGAYNSQFVQTVWSKYGDARNLSVTRTILDGVAGEWEWINPPLTADETEYRTTERVDSKAVYKKMDAKGRLFWRLDGSDTWTLGAPGLAPANVSVPWTLDTVGWYKIGTLYSAESHSSSAIITIGETYYYNTPNSITVDISGSYNSVDSFVRSRTGTNSSTQFTKLGIVMNNYQNFDIYLYYTNSQINSGVIKIDPTIGSFIKEDSLTVASLTDSDFTKIVDLKTLSFALSSHSHSYLPLSGGTLTGSLSVGNSTSTNYCDLNVARLGTDGTEGNLWLAINGGNATGVLGWNKNGTTASKLTFSDGSASFGNNLIVNGNINATGTISEGGTLLSNKYVQTANLTNFRSKNLGQPGDYRWFVIPLVCLDNTEIQADRYFMGDIVLKRVNGLSSLATTIHINCGKQYNSTLPYYTMSIEGRGSGDSVGYFAPCSFTYNGKLHFGICGQGMNATYDGTDNHASGYSLDWSIINIVPYYNNNTGSAENTEIYNSLSFYSTNDNVMLANSFFGTPRVLIPNGTSSPTVYGIYHTGNKPSPDDIGAVPTSRTVNGKALSSNISLTYSDVGAAASSHNHDAGNITSGTLPVSRGGTGTTSFTSGQVLIGNGTSAISTRAINDSYTLSHINYNSSLITGNTLAFWNGAYDSNGTSNISKLGTVTKGNWNAGTIAITYGGTGATTALGARTNLDAASVPIRLYNTAQPSATNLLIIKTSIAATSYGTMIHGTIRGNSYQSSQLFDVTFQVYNYESGSILAGHCYDAVSAFKNMTMLRGNDGFIYFAAELNTYQPYQTYDIHIGKQGGVHENLATSAYFGAKPAASKTYSLTMQYGLTTNNYSSYALPKSGGTMSGTIKWSNSLTKVTSPNVVATFINNDSAQGLGYASTSDLSVGSATLLKPTDNTSTTTVSVSDWAGNTSSGKIVWREKFTESSLGTDNGAILFWLTKNTAAGGVGLNITIDGQLYQNMDKVVLDSGNYSSYCAPASHTHSYLPLSGGTLSGNVIAAATAIGTNAIRNIHGGTGALTAGSSALTTGSIYVQYV